MSKATSTPNAGYDRTEPKMSAVALWGLAIIVALVGVIVVVQSYFDQVHERQVYRRVLDPVAESLIDVRSREVRRLHSYQYVDDPPGTVRLPIDRAMELIAAEYAEDRLPYSTNPTPVKAEPEAPETVATAGSDVGAPAP